MTDRRRKILLTGPTSGIGAELAQLWASDHDVLGVGRRAEHDATLLLPEGVRYLQADLSEPHQATEAVAETLLKQGWTSLDNTVLNAGTGFVCDNGLDSVEAIRSTLDTNLVSTVLLGKALYPWLAKANGTLTFVGSVAHSGAAMFPAYAASKAGLHGFARALRSEWQGRVTVQIVHPGPTRTEMHAKAGHDPGAMANIFLKPEDVAAMLGGCVASGRSPVTASFGRYLTGGARFARRL